MQTDNAMGFSILERIEKQLVRLYQIHGHYDLVQDAYDTATKLTKEAIDDIDLPVEHVEQINQYLGTARWALGYKDFAVGAYSTMPVDSLIAALEVLGQSVAYALGVHQTQKESAIEMLASARQFVYSNPSEVADSLYEIQAHLRTSSGPERLGGRAAFLAAVAHTLSKAPSASTLEAADKMMKEIMDSLLW